MQHFRLHLQVPTWRTSGSMAWTTRWRSATNREAVMAGKSYEVLYEKVVISWVLHGKSPNSADFFWIARKHANMEYVDQNYGKKHSKTANMMGHFKVGPDWNCWDTKKIHNQPSFFLLKFNFCGVFPMFIHTHPKTQAFYGVQFMVQPGPWPLSQEIVSQLAKQKPTDPYKRLGPSESAF